MFYRLMYWFGRPRWDTGITPPEVVQAFETGSVPPGMALDLGCGTGTNAIYMAHQGRQVTGIDFVPQAVSRARAKARQARVTDGTKFIAADVTRLDALELPQFGYALDIGCFHGLSPDGQSRYARGLAGRLASGGLYMLYTHDPRPQAARSFGVTPDQVQAVFAPWFTLERLARGADGGHGSTWFWMRRI